MPVAVKGQRICHYCGKRSRSANKQQFRCQHCLAENFVDENGEVADVPPDSQETPKQYARPVHVQEADPVFCRTCLKNQAMYTAALSDFLPDPEDPEYDKFEAALPAFKDRMERQFPQCCAQCEPKVRAQLKQAMYHARSDHLRRALDKSRMRRVAHRLGWRRLLIFAAGMGYHISLVIQLAWHFMGSQSARSKCHISSSVECLRTWPIPSCCPDLLEPYLGMAFALGISCIWWNPRWQSRLAGSTGRLKGLSQYYRCQAALLAMRYAVWSLISDVPKLQHHRQKMHSMALVLIMLCAGYASVIVSIDDKPLVNWQSEPDQLLTKGQFEPPLISPPLSQQSQYSIEDLVSVENDHVEAWRPPTPPIEGEEMDWDPSPATLTAQPRALNYRSSQPTPFHGTLPQLPRGNIFARTDLPRGSQSIGIPMGFFDKPNQEKLRSNSEKTSLAQPTFFPNQDRVDTGLENIFGKVFSLHDDAVEVRNRVSSLSHPVQAAVQGKKHSVSTSVSSVTRSVAAISIAMLTCFLIWLSALRILQDFSPRTTSNILVLAITVPLLEAIATSIQQIFDTKVLYYVIECGFLFGLVSYQPLSDSLLVPLWNKVVLGTLFGLLMQEIFTFCAHEDFNSPFASSLVEPQPDTHTSPPPPPSIISDVTAIDLTPSASQLSRRDSVSSVGSVSSINTTSTASGWKTPITNHRLEMADSNSPGRPYNTRQNDSTTNTFGFGRLGINNSNNFTVGSSVAGPRTTRRNGVR